MFPLSMESGPGWSIGSAVCAPELVLRCSAVRMWYWGAVLLSADDVSWVWFSIPVACTLTIGVSANQLTREGYIGIKKKPNSAMQRT